jgi:hypothetical protein
MTRWGASQAPDVLAPPASDAALAVVSVLAAIVAVVAICLG